MGGREGGRDGRELGRKAGNEGGRERRTDERKCKTYPDSVDSLDGIHHNAIFFEFHLEHFHLALVSYQDPLGGEV